MHASKLCLFGGYTNPILSCILSVGSFTHTPVCLSVCLSVSVSLSVCLSVCQSARQLICQTVKNIFYGTINQILEKVKGFFLFVCLSVCLSLSILIYFYTQSVFWSAAPEGSLTYGTAGHLIYVARCKKNQLFSIAPLFFESTQFLDALSYEVGIILKLKILKRSLQTSHSFLRINSYVMDILLKK